MCTALYFTFHLNFTWIQFTIDEKKRNNNHFPDENYSKNSVAQTITMTTITVRSPFCTTMITVHTFNLLDTKPFIETRFHLFFPIFVRLTSIK